MQYSPASCYYFWKSTYSYVHPVPSHPQSVFFSSSERTSLTAIQYSRQGYRPSFSCYNLYVFKWKNLNVTIHFKKKGKNSFWVYKEYIYVEGGGLVRGAATYLYNFVRS
jgi:hypothetical protein